MIISSEQMKEKFAPGKKLNNKIYNPFSNVKSVLETCTIECFHMTSRRPYWCSKQILWEMNSLKVYNIGFHVIKAQLANCGSLYGLISIESQQVFFRGVTSKFKSYILSLSFHH